MNTQACPIFTAQVGLDWADAKHDFCLQPGGGGSREFGRFLHQPDQIDAWAQGLNARFGGTIAVAMELTQGPIVFALQKYDFIVLFPVDPSLLALLSEINPLRGFASLTKWPKVSLWSLSSSAGPIGGSPR